MKRFKGFINKKKFNKTKIFFQEKNILLSSIRREYKCKTSLLIKKEVLPSVYFTCINLFDFYYVDVNIKNKNNCIYIIPGKIKHKKKSGTSLQNQVKSLGNDSNKDYFENDKFKEVELSKIPFPNTMGSLSSCPVYCYFKNRYIVDYKFQEDDAYSMFSISQIFANVHKYRTLTNLCDKYYHCQDILKHINDRDYNDFSPIKVNKIGDNYSISDGKHRICVAKRYGIDKLNMRVWSSNDYKSNYDIIESDKFLFDKCKKIMGTYEKILNENNLSKEDGKYLLETPIDEINLVSFLESKKCL